MGGIHKTVYTKLYVRGMVGIKVGWIFLFNRDDISEFWT